MLRSVGSVEEFVMAWGEAQPWQQGVVIGMVGMVVILLLWWLDVREGR